jgi:hypothetical protein
MGERMGSQPRVSIILAAVLFLLSAAGCAAKPDSPPPTAAPAVEASSTPYRFDLAGKREFQTDAVVQSPDATSVAIRVPATVMGIPVFESLRVTNPHHIKLRDAVPGLNMSVAIEYRNGELQLKSAGLPHNGPLLSSWPFFRYAGPPGSGFPGPTSSKLPVDQWPSNYTTSAPTTSAPPWLVLSSSGTATLDAMTAGAAASDGDGPIPTWWSLEVQVPGTFDGQPMRHLLTVWGNPSSSIVDTSGKTVLFQDIASKGPAWLKVSVEKVGPTLFARRIEVGQNVDAGNW